MNEPLPGPALLRSRFMRVLPWVGWLGVFAILTTVLVQARTELELTNIVLLYVLVVLGGSASGSRSLGFTLAALGFCAIDYWFQLPYDTITVAKPVDWLALITFLATAVVTTQLLARARSREAEARQHAETVTLMARQLERAEALREADRFRDTLVASVSHDFRTPLTTIKALADSITQSHSVSDRVDLHSAAKIIAEQADRLADLVDNVLDFSRMRAGSLPVFAEVNTAEDLVGAAARQARAMLGDHPVETDIDWTAPALIGWFDFSHALRALTNLIVNAAKYSPPQSPVSIAVSRDDGILAIAVADRGCGVSPAERDRIFEPFYRPRGATPDIGGAGLGLAIARQLAEVQHGSIEYAPRAGGGSVFTLRLPAASVSDDSELGAP